jgi:hypothetical protein
MDEIEPIGHPLKKISKEAPFKVPEGYFEAFGDRLNERIHFEERNMVPVRKLHYWKPLIAAAAIIIVVVVTINSLYRNYSGRYASKMLQRQISQVIEQELYSIPEETILEVMDRNVLDPLTGSPVSNNDMIDYLLNEGLDDIELLNEL